MDSTPMQVSLPPGVTWSMVAVGALKVLQYALAIAVVKWPGAPTWLKLIKTALDDVLPNPSLPQVRAMVAQPPVLGQQLPRPPGPGTLVVILGLLLVASSARAQVWSAGLSVPLLEIQPGNPHPVAFAPGAGVEGQLGLFQTTIAGAETDLLDFGAILFANAPGAMQVALTVGTLGGLICAGVAVPLYALDGSGAFQGQAHVYPVLGGSIPFDLGAAPGASIPSGPPPLPTSLPQLTPRPRLGTVYFGVL